MTVITAEDFTGSIADSLQYISFFHPPDFIRAMARAYEREESEAARSAISQILVNSRMAAEGHRPICQDTGIVVVFLKIGMEVRFDSRLPLQDLVDEGVRRAWNHPDNPLRASIVAPAFGARRNTMDNTPAVVHTELVAGNRLDVIIAAKGGGSENKARFAILNPDDDLVAWVIDTLPGMGAGWCPPGILGLGVGGTPEKALLLAKESLMAPIDMDDIIARGPTTEQEKLRLDLQPGQRTWHWRARSGWAHHRARRQAARLPYPRCVATCRHDSQLCGQPPHPFFARRRRASASRAPPPRRLAGSRLSAQQPEPSGEP